MENEWEKFCIIDSVSNREPITLWIRNMNTEWIHEISPTKCLAISKYIAHSERLALHKSKVCVILENFVRGFLPNFPWMYSPNFWQQIANHVCILDKWVGQLSDDGNGIILYFNVLSSYLWSCIVWNWFFFLLMRLSLACWLSSLRSSRSIRI